MIGQRRRTREPLVGLCLFRAGVRDGIDHPGAPSPVNDRIFRAGAAIGRHLARP